MEDKGTANNRKDYFSEIESSFKMDEEGFYKFYGMY